MVRLGGPTRLRDRRLAAYRRFEAASWPSDTKPLWRYSRIADFALDRYQPLPPVASERDEPGGAPSELSGLLDAIGPLAALVVVRNGRTVSQPITHPAVGVEVAYQLPDDSGDDLFVSLNTAYCAAPVTMTVADRAVVAQPVVVVNWLDQPAAAVFPRLWVRVGAEAQVSIIEVVASAGGGGERETGSRGAAGLDGLVVPVTDVDVAPAANVSHLNLQLLDEQTWQVGTLRHQVRADATVTSMAAALGGAYARLRTDCALVGRGATGRLRAVYFGAGRQVHDFRTIPDHQEAKTTSDLLYKGAVTNRAEAVYSGLIRVAKGAKGTNAFQTNRNLVLHEGAHAYSVPDLEIKENDVRCSHASAIGPIDEDQRFYLESRGVPTDVAERLITLGFLDEVLVEAPVDGLVGWLRHEVAAKLARAEQAEAHLDAQLRQ